MAKKRTGHTTGLVVLGLGSLLFGGPPGLVLFGMIVVYAKILGG